MSKILLGAFAYVVLTLSLGFVWNLILFRDVYVAIGSQSMRAAPVMPLGLAAIVIEAVVLGFLFAKLSDGSISQGLVLAFAVGAFSMTYGGLVVPAKFMIEPIATYVLLESAFGVLHYGAAGTTLAFVFRP